MKNKDIYDRKRAIEKEERAAREELLKEHQEKYQELRKELYIACEEAGGHHWYALPDNGFNGPHFVTREWPMACSDCGKSRTFGWTERGEK